MVKLAKLILIYILAKYNEVRLRFEHLFTNRPPQEPEETERGSKCH